MTFDIDQAMSERFQKAEILHPAYDVRGNLAYKDSTGAETLHAPHTPATYNMADTLGEDRIADKWGWYENDMWNAIMDMMKVPQENKALYDDLSERVRQIVKDLRANNVKFDQYGMKTAMDDALVEALNSAQNAEDKERVTKKMKDKYAPEDSQYKKGRKAEADWEKAKKEEAGPMSEEQLAEKRKKESSAPPNIFEGTGSFKLSCDIDSRMNQWDAANRAQCAEDIETILKSYVEAARSKFARESDGKTSADPNTAADTGRPTPKEDPDIPKGTTTVAERFTMDSNGNMVLPNDSGEDYAARDPKVGKIKRVQSE